MHEIDRSPPPLQTASSTRWRKGWIVTALLFILLVVATKTLSSAESIHVVEAPVEVKKAVAKKSSLDVEAPTESTETETNKKSNTDVEAPTEVNEAPANKKSNTDVEAPTESTETETNEEAHSDTEHSIEPVITSNKNQQRRTAVERSILEEVAAVSTLNAPLTPLRAIAEGVKYRRVGDYQPRVPKKSSTGNNTAPKIWFHDRLYDNYHRQQEFHSSNNNHHVKKNGFGWRFVKYHPSPFEMDWITAIKPIEHKDSIASLRAPFRDRFQVYFNALPTQAMRPNWNASAEYAQECVNYFLSTNEQKQRPEASSRLFADEIAKMSHPKAPAGSLCGGFPDVANGVDAEQKALNDDVFSRMEYRFECLDDGSTDPSRSCDTNLFPSSTGGAQPAVGDTHFSYIEPLVGVLRHPSMFYSTAEKPDFLNIVMNKQYLIVDRWALNHLGYRWQNAQQKNAFYVDLGASTLLRDPAGGSQEWLIPLMNCQCVPPTDLFLWEVEHIADQAEIYRTLPGPLQPRYHFYNIPLEVKSSSWNNPLNVLLDQVKDPDDVIFFKLDFDRKYMEAEIVQFIQNNPELYQLIDEFYFEHHVNMPVMKRYWRTSSRSRHTFATDSIRMFQELREKGIRAHSWV